MGNHTITIQPDVHIEGRGSIPYTFRAWCSCGEWGETNAPKWVFHAIQDHYVQAGLTNGRGLL